MDRYIIIFAVLMSMLAIAICVPVGHILYYRNVNVIETKEEFHEAAFASFKQAESYAFDNNFKDRETCKKDVWDYWTESREASLDVVTDNSTAVSYVVSVKETVMHIQVDENFGQIYFGSIALFAIFLIIGAAIGDLLGKDICDASQGDRMY